MAAWLGVGATYNDVFGTACHASNESLQAVAGVLVGQPGASVGELAEAVQQRQRAMAMRLVPDVVVAWQPGPVVVVVTVPPGVRRIAMSVTLDPHGDDGGGVRSLVVDPASGSAGGSAAGAAGDRPGNRRAIAVDLAGLELPIGRHRLRVLVESQGGVGSHTRESEDATVVVAPLQLPGFGDDARLWGVFAPVWSAWSHRRPEVHLGQLDAVGAWTATHGATLVGTLPMLATFLDRPVDPSPYSPVSRQWWNEALVDLDACVGISECADAGSLRTLVGPADPAAPYDAPSQWVRTRAVLAALAAHASEAGTLTSLVDTFVADNPGVVDYARFRATVERTGTGWHAWPEAARRGHLDARVGDADVRMWIHAQWEVRRQLADLGSHMDDRGQRLYLDLALGANGDGFDTWTDQALFGWGAAVGAPPDEFFTAGQNWGFPAVLPGASRATGHEYVAACLRAHLQVCTVLRLDHVMGLQRLFVIPDGMGADGGAYVAQPMEELLAVLSVEAWRAGAVVIGENLGTVDPGVVDAMDRHGLYGMYVGQFEVPTGADADTNMVLPGPRVLASVNTHDTPSFAGWIAADDADRRRDMGLLDDAGVVAQRELRTIQVGRLRAELIRHRALDIDAVGSAGPADDPVALLAGLLEVMGATDVPAVLVSVDDLVGAVEPQNVPGTPAERPNWVLRLPVPIDDLIADSRVTTVLQRLDAARRAGAGGGGGAGAGDDNGSGVGIGDGIGDSTGDGND